VLVLMLLVAVVAVDATAGADAASGSGFCYCCCWWLLLLLLLVLVLVLISVLLSSSFSKRFSAQRQKVFGEASFMGFYRYLFESFVIMHKIIGGKAQCLEERLYCL